MKGITTVRNQRTGEEKVYPGLGAMESVIAAYAEERGDYDAPNYMNKYRDNVWVTGIVVNCGDWSATY